MASILIIDDKKSMLEMLSQTFRAEGFDVIVACGFKEAMRAIEIGRMDAVVTDLKMPDGDGLSILATMRQRFPLIPVILMTAHGSIETAVRAVKEGAYDFVSKPFDPEHLLIVVRRALAEGLSRKENIILKGEIKRYQGKADMIGSSPVWADLLDKVRKVAPTRSTVLVLGESGTGKELVARTIHRLSGRASSQFIAVNCAAIPKDLIESELFGHEKGAFTGAQEFKLGKFELASGGSVFLDEIGDMDLSLQAKLLRVLQEQEIERVGGTQPISVDLRVIAASNKDLQKEVAAGRFREDLFYRLNVFPLFVPPLRERVADVVPLAEYFISRFSAEMGKPAAALSDKAIAMLKAYEWKGNVRELKNVIERAVIMCDSATIDARHLRLESSTDALPSSDASLLEVSGSAARIAEKAKIEEVLRRTGGNKTRAADILQVSYKTLLTKIKEYGILSE